MLIIQEDECVTQGVLRTPDKYTRSQTGNPVEVQQRFVYALATYLICAEKYSYFLAHDGYGIDNGKSRFWMKEIPEYSRPLGAPNGPAVKSEWTYTREFEYAWVNLDIQNEQAEIIWGTKK